MQFDYQDKHVFVAGGTSGINLGIALGFAAEGAKVSVLSRSQEKVDAALAALKEAGAPDAQGFSADVRKFDAIESAINASAESFGKIDVLVSGAAGNFPALAKDLSPNGFKSVVDIDLIGTFHVLKAGYPHLTRPGASVINISAPQAQNAMVVQAHVCAAKAGVDMLTRVLAMEWGPEGIRVNSIIPGPIDETEGMRRLAPTDELRSMVKRSVPLGRMGQVDDVANLALMMSAPQSSYLSGAVIPIDGGWSLAGDRLAMFQLLEAMMKGQVSS